MEKKSGMGSEGHRERRRKGDGVEGNEEGEYEEGTIGVSELERIVSLRNTESGVIAKTPNKYKVESSWFFGILSNILMMCNDGLARCVLGGIHMFFNIYPGIPLSFLQEVNLSPVLQLFMLYICKLIAKFVK